MGEQAGVCPTDPNAGSTTRLSCLGVGAVRVDGSSPMPHSLFLLYPHDLSLSVAKPTWSLILSRDSNFLLLFSSQMLHRNSSFPMFA